MVVVAHGGLVAVLVPWSPLQWTVVVVVTQPPRYLNVLALWVERVWISRRSCDYASSMVGPYYYS